MVALVVLLVLLWTQPGVSQANGNDSTDTTGIVLRTICGGNPVTNVATFIKNRNTTLNDLRMQLSSERQVYARAQALSELDSVYAVAQCRHYLSVDQCVACFDVGVSRLLDCPAANAYISYDKCFLRYESYKDFINNPYFSVDRNGFQVIICGNQSSSQPTTFNQVVGGLLSDIRVATPKTSNYYVATTRQIINTEDTKVYVTAQCVENITQSVCQTCMNSANEKLNGCLPFTQGRYGDMACYARYSETPLFNDSQTTDITNVLEGPHSSKLVAIVAGAISGVVLCFVILVLWVLYIRRLRKKSKKTEEGDLDGAVYYNYESLKLATNNFSQENIIGKGGYGEVFKALLDDKSMVAVKKLQVQHVGKANFENEVKLICNIQHRNLLRLFGWSSEGSDLLLVLEYMPNGSLDRFLWGPQRGTLNWNQRYEIVFGIARGLMHLHDEYHIKIVHRDIKSSNILLGDDSRPKIADFGLARFHPEGLSHVSTLAAGTMGYMPPEYAICGFLSDKVDTYSFGIVVLEIISGRSCTEVTPGSSNGYLLKDAWEMHENTTCINLIDETLKLNEHEQEHVMKIIPIALWCTQQRASERPTMSEVVAMLQEGRSSGERQLTRPNFLINEDRRIHVLTKD